MSSVLIFVKGVRNHWKKSTFAAVVVTYGTSYAVNRINTNNLMRSYCEKAAQYGAATIPASANPRTITVILNPNANRRKAAKDFEKYCAPILHLAGMLVDVVQTESEGHARTIASELKNTDAVVVAGGDGTVSEVITGLLRSVRNDHAPHCCPIGVLPLGRSNTVSKSFFPGGNDSLQKVRSLADASMAVVEEVTKAVDVMRIEVLDEETKEEKKPIYAVAGIEWGAYRDAQANKDKYWYFGPLRSYATYIFNGYKNSLCWNCEATLNYSPPCAGCSNCYVKDQSNRRWYHIFLPYRKQSVDYSQVKNTACKTQLEKDIETSDFRLLPNSGTDGPSRLALDLGPKAVHYFSFVTQGFQTAAGKERDSVECIEARQVEIRPKMISSDEREYWFSIDNENYELKPVRVTLLPKVIDMFCKAKDTV